MVNYFVCPCLFDTISAIKSDDVAELMKFLSVNYLIIECNRAFYIACRDAVDFYSECIRKDEDCDTCFTSDEPISCLDLICYGFEDSCSNCERVILNFFSDYLCKIEK